MKFEDLYRIYMKNDFENSYFVDKNNMEILSFPTKDLKKICEDLLLEEETDIIKFLNDNKHYFLIPTLEPFDYLKAKRAFIRESSLEIRKEISSFKDDIEDINPFIEKIKELNILDLWEKTFKEQIEDNIYLWLINNDINLVPHNQRYNKIFEYMRKIYHLKPWHYFSNQELIRLSISELNIYVNFNLLEDGYGDFVVYYDKEGLCDFEVLKEFDHDEYNLMNSFKTCIRCAYLPETKIGEEAMAIFNKSNTNLEFYYPSIEFYKEGHIVTNHLDHYILVLLEEVVRILYAGLLDYINYPICLNRDKNEFLSIDVLDNDELVLKGFLYQKSNKIRDFGFSYKEKETTCLLDKYKKYEVKLDCFIPSNLCYDNPYYIYYIIVVDCDSDEVIYYDQNTYSESDKSISLLKDKFSKYIEEDGFAKNIYVDDYFTRQLILETVGNDAEINYQEVSYFLRYVIDNIHQLEFDDRNEGNIVLS